jgi:hypothetical protein
MSTLAAVLTYRRIFFSIYLFTDEWHVFPVFPGGAARFLFTQLPYDAVCRLVFQCEDSVLHKRFMAHDVFGFTDRRVFIVRCYIRSCWGYTPVCLSHIRTVTRSNVWSGVPPVMGLVFYTFISVSEAALGGLPLDPTGYSVAGSHPTEDGGFLWVIKIPSTHFLLRGSKAVGPLS